MAERGIPGRGPGRQGPAEPQETDRFDLARQGVARYDLDRCVGCGQCHIVCNDAGGQALEWDEATRRPKLTEDKCLSCMVCSFVCPVPALISFKEMPKGWSRQATRVMDTDMIGRVKLPQGGMQ